MIPWNRSFWNRRLSILATSPLLFSCRGIYTRQKLSHLFPYYYMSCFFVACVPFYFGAEGQARRSADLAVSVFFVLVSWGWGSILNVLTSCRALIDCVPFKAQNAGYTMIMYTCFEVYIMRAKRGNVEFIFDSREPCYDSASCSVPADGAPHELNSPLWRRPGNGFW